MMKRILIGLGVLTLAAIMAGSTTLIDLRYDTAVPDHPAIALVNEDRSATFNGIDYLFGADFVNLVSHDQQYEWHVVSRSVAENAYADTSVSAVLYLPESFSHDILTLQNLDPVKATIDYKLRTDGTELSRRVLENQIVTILRDFNSRVVTMYFASIAGTLSEAQVSMASVVGSQSTLVDALALQHSPDLQATNETYSDSASLAGVLEAMSAAWVSAQNSFTDTTTNTLTSMGSALADRQPQLTEYFSQQAEIARTNTANANDAITAQNESDRVHYRNAFSDHLAQLTSGTSEWTGFDGFFAPNTAGDGTGVLAGLKHAGAGYNAQAADFAVRIDAARNTLDAQLDTLESSQRELETLETRLLEEYFSITLPEDNTAIGIPGDEAAINDHNYAIDTTMLTTDMARRALARKVARSFGGDSSFAPLSQYEQSVRDFVATIPTDATRYAQLFALLRANTSFDPGPVEDQLAVLRNFDHAHGIVPPVLDIVSLATNTAGQASGQSIDKTIPVSVPPGTSYTVTASLPAPLSSADVAVSTGLPSPACPATMPLCVRVDTATATATIDNTTGNEALTVPVNYAIALRELTGRATLGFTARDDSAPSSADVVDLGTDVFVLVPSNPANEGIGGEDFEAITSVLSDIRTASHLLLFLFGGPGDTLATFAHAAAAIDDFTDISTDSVVNRYGTVDSSRLEEALSDADVASYHELGHDNIREVINRIHDVREAIHAAEDSVATLSGLSLSDTYFSDTIDELHTWHAAAMRSILAAAAQWDANVSVATQLPLLPWQEQEQGLPELYLDQDTGPAVHHALSALIATASKDAESIAASAQIIVDNSAQFDELLTGIATTQARSHAVLEAMNGTITTGSSELSTASAYSERFATVLSNTRTAGVDPDAVYDAFANPVTTHDASPAPSSTANAFDIRWLLSFVSGSLLGGMVISVVMWRRGRQSRPAAMERPKNDAPPTASLI